MPPAHLSEKSRWCHQLNIPWDWQMALSRAFRGHIKSLIFEQCRKGARPPRVIYLMNDIPIDVACHRYTLNMQVSSGTKNNYSPNARAILHHRNGVVQWCFLGDNGYVALFILKPGQN
ncbi:hypothetical protein TNCV_2534081 [Trichonephila clavipes]|nr:hypothetical protein TNCV_2534081 [Trichonephila clavipes]